MNTIVDSTADFIAAVYREDANSNIDLARKPSDDRSRYAEKVLYGHLDDSRPRRLRPGHFIYQNPTRQNCPAGRHRPDGHSPVHVSRQKRGRSTGYSPLRSSDQGPSRRGRRSCCRREENSEVYDFLDIRFTSATVSAAGCPAPASSTRLSWSNMPFPGLDDARHRLPYPQWRRTRRFASGCRRCRCGGCDGRTALGGVASERLSAFT